MNDLPEPMTPPDCDLRGYEFMPLHGSKLFGSRLYGKSLRNPRAGLAAMKLWWVAWQQCPAGSLPNDDDDLAFLADFGTDTKGWLKCREIALHGFVLCSDGRLYHPLLCAEAVRVYENRASERDRKAQQRAAKKAKRDKEMSGTSSASPGDVPDLSHGTSYGHAEGQTEDVRSKRRGEENIPSLRSGRPAPITAPDQPVDARTRLFAEGKATLSHMTGKSASQCGALLGRWLKTCGDQCDLLLSVIHDAADQRPAEAVPWIERAIQSRISASPASLTRTERVAAAWANVPDFPGV